MKVAIVGGHMAPAFSFLEALPKDVGVVYIGRKHAFEGDSSTSLEYQIATQKGIRFISFSTGRVQRKLTIHTIPSLLKLPRGLVSAWQILRKERPDVVVGFGGYLSVPIGIAAFVLGIPLVIHEQTRGAGLGNKLLIPFARKICLSWDSSRQYFPKQKVVMTGNPILPFDNANMHTVPFPKSKEKLPLIVVVGGSGGSHAINSLILSILPKLLLVAKLLHQTGDAKEFGDFDKIVAKALTLPKNLQDRYSAVKFIDPQIVNAVFALSDVVVSRSGINTVCALYLLKKKAILIPVAVGQKNEQLDNAKFLEDSGYATILEQKDVTPEKLLAAIQAQMHEKITEKKHHIQFYPNGAKNLVTVVLQCLFPLKQNEK